MQQNSATLYTEALEISSDIISECYLGYLRGRGFPTNMPNPNPTQLQNNKGGVRLHRFHQACPPNSKSIKAVTMRLGG